MALKNTHFQGILTYIIRYGKIPKDNGWGGKTPCCYGRALEQALEILS